MRNHSAHKISGLTAFFIVVANMIGTGAFTSLGFQLQDLKSPTVILILWILGGVLALSGAFSYVEIGSRIKKSGGEYTFLSTIYSPVIGYLAGWISITVGFAAPVALSAMAVVAYFPYAVLDPVWTSCLLVISISIIHSISLRYSATFQNISTGIKIVLIISLILLGLFLAPSTTQQYNTEGISSEIFSGSFFIALIYVSYSYTGWNAAVYIIEELRDLKRSLIFALIGGTLFVALLYTLLQYIFIKHVPLESLVGQIDVGSIAAKAMLGEQVGSLFSLAISVLLISGISAMIWVGPRVSAAMARDHKLWRSIAAPADVIPTRALWLQCAITLGLVVSGTFEQILIYCGFLLTISTLLTVYGLFKLRKTGQDQDGDDQIFVSPGYPFLQVLFITFSIAMIIFTFIARPYEALLGSLNLIIGLITWFFNKRIINR